MNFLLPPYPWKEPEPGVYYYGGDDPAEGRGRRWNRVYHDWYYGPGNHEAVGFFRATTDEIGVRVCGGERTDFLAGSKDKSA